MQTPNFGRKEAIEKLFEFSEFERIMKLSYLRIGKETVGEKFTIQKELAQTITDILIYFAGNTGKYDLSKGIYIYGTYGIGKTTIFAIIRKLLAETAPFLENGKRYNPNGFQITSIEKILDVYKSDGNLDYYGYRKESTPMHVCINEFGKQVNEKIYGTEATELINSLFMIRYELFQQGYLTHCTSNFHPKQLKVERLIADRMNEMFNFIEINGESLRV